MNIRHTSPARVLACHPVCPTFSPFGHSPAVPTRRSLAQVRFLIWSQNRRIHSAMTGTRGCTLRPAQPCQALEICKRGRCQESGTSESRRRARLARLVRPRLARRPAHTPHDPAHLGGPDPRQDTKKPLGCPPTHTPLGPGDPYTHLASPALTRNFPSPLRRPTRLSQLVRS